jgi:general secretion pathway protein I
VSKKSCNGFTLIEVMVALSIVALSLTAVTASISQMINTAESMRNRTYASWIALNRITEFRLETTAPEEGSTTGEVEYANTDWFWRAVVSETGVDDLYRVDVSVSLAGSDDNIRTVTGFVGLAGAPGEANGAWMRSTPSGQSPGASPDNSPGTRPRVPPRGSSESTS